MKQEIFPQIPQQEMPQTHSMYQQLKMTSQKWFTRSRKSIFDVSSHHYSSNDPQDNKKDSVYVPDYLGQDSNTNQKARLMELMKEQIEISCHQYANKMKGLLQDQAKKIKILGDLLIKNQHQLSKKDHILEQLTLYIRQTTASKTRSNPKDISKLENKIQQLEQKLANIESILAQNVSEEKISKINSKLNSCLSQVSQTYLTRLDNVREELQDRLDRLQKMNHLNQSTTRGIRSTVNMHKDNVAGEQLERKVDTLHAEVDDLRHEIQSFRRRKYVYDNYKLDETEEKLAQLTEKVASLEAPSSCLNPRKSSHSTSHGTLKASQTTHMTHTEVNSMAKSSSKSNFVNKYKSMINNRKLREEHYYSEQSSDQSQVQQTFVQHFQTNVERFTFVIQQTKMQMPVFIEVDQTGYAKSVDTGMYLVDTTGNGFEFTISELEHLRSRGIISMI